MRRLATRVPTGLTARKYAHSESESGRSILTDRPVVAPFVDTRTDPPTDVSVNFCAQASSTTKEEDTLRSGLGPDDLPDLMNGEDLGILATRRPDDSIMLSPVWWEWRDGAFYIWAEDDSDRKVRHIERDPRVTFLVPNQHRPYQGYEIRGEATLSRDPTLFYDILGRTTARWDGPAAAEEWVSTYPVGVVIRIEPGIERGWEID